MPATEGKLVQLSVFKDLPDRAIREHSFAANHYKGLKDTLELSIGSSGTVVELVNKGVGHPPQISAETEYWLVVTKGEETKEIRIEGARTWEPGTTLEVPLPFPHEAPESIQVDFVRKGKTGFQERLIRVLL
jgi:hypothetical protein